LILKHIENIDKYLDTLSRVPVFLEEKVKTAMYFLIDITLLIAETTFRLQ
jgi:hypothetical protein